MKNYHPVEYDHDIHGRIIKVGKRPFNLEFALKSWETTQPDPVYRQLTWMQAKKDCERKGHAYSAQCLNDLLEAL